MCFRAYGGAGEQTKGELKKSEERQVGRASSWQEGAAGIIEPAG